MRIIGLVCSRHELIARLRLTTPAGLPLLADSTVQDTIHVELS
ncbi:MAG TPA: hypothetical protein VMF09_07815 [Solirubrobacteraceae bacterium]|nr:hypothetical protein [Solirubrobacteraceae bacterium]